MALKLDVLAAERFLTGLPLLSLEREESLRGIVLQRSKSLDGVQKTVSQTGLAPVDVEEELKRTVSWAATGIPIPRMPMDVAAAERFLTSLTVCEADVVQESHGLVGFGWPPTELLQASGAKCSKTVIGGWRSHADLQRLMPVLVKKGVVGGRVDITTRQTCTYISSTQLGDTSYSGHTLDMPEVKLPLLARSSRRWLSWGRRSTRVEQVKGTSYAKFLVPSVGGTYDPDFLDDQSLRQGKNHTVLRLEGYQVSIIPFVRARRLKDELNDQFRCSHPQVHPSLTLSKLRNLQKDLREITQTMPELDVCSVALAWVYFEKLVLKDYVRKASRKLLAGACLVLAYKFHQRGDRDKIRKLAAEIRKMDRKDRLQWEDLHEAELKVFVWLEFSLHVPASEVLPHLQRTMKDLGMSWQEIGEAGCQQLQRPSDDDGDVALRDCSTSFY
ncbi:unnamed protein product [Effrenium voratum]|uniref:Cyclin N-terminal domain-containing protein n=1 Tax=Effrenium voratum TaxID=2562239 RepID=A0AA36J3U0_9DINO|nr:unnamed protein product [Effrenium voratum]CAJ1399092.1 unnamed protein product [Effrenium voratum]